MRGAMDNPNPEIALLQELLNLEFPRSYCNFLGDYDAMNRKLPIPILGAGVSLDESSVWGATEFLRAARTDLDSHFLTVILLDTLAICLDLKSGGEHDAPVVRIKLAPETPPAQPELISPSFADFLDMLQKDPDRILSSAGVTAHPVDDYWFQRGLERLGWHVDNLSFAYDHKDGGQLPRSHVWRPYRFCVQDVILGITVVRHDRKYNRQEVDVFLTASIKEYAPDSGCRAICLIILSDAYKSGGSMEIKFSKNVEGGRVPHELVSLAASLHVDLAHVSDGGISPREAKQLYLALSGFSEITRAKIATLENEGRVSSASISYGMHHGVWSIPELDVILFGSRFPNTILRGAFSPEDWHLFHYDLFHARNALMGGYLDLQLAKREYPQESGSVIELEDDELDLEILFNADYFCKVYALRDADSAVTVPWITGADQPLKLSGENKLWTLLRARDMEDLQADLRADLHQAAALKKTLAAHDDSVCVMIPSDFKRLEPVERTGILDQFRKERIGLMICPDFLTQLNQEVCRRFEAIKVIRQ